MESKCSLSLALKPRSIAASRASATRRTFERNAIPLGVRFDSLRRPRDARVSRMPNFTNALRLRLIAALSDPNPDANSAPLDHPSDARKHKILQSTNPIPASFRYAADAPCDNRFAAAVNTAGTHRERSICRVISSTSSACASASFASALFPPLRTVFLAATSWSFGVFKVDTPDVCGDDPKVGRGL